MLPGSSGAGPRSEISRAEAYSALLGTLLGPLPHRAVDGPHAGVSLVIDLAAHGDVRNPERHRVVHGLGNPECLQSSIVEDRIAIPVPEMQQHGGRGPPNPGQGHRDPDAQCLGRRSEREPRSLPHLLAGVRRDSRPGPRRLPRAELDELGASEVPAFTGRRPDLIHYPPFRRIRIPALREPGSGSRRTGARTQGIHFAQRSCVGRPDGGSGMHASQQRFHAPKRRERYPPKAGRMAFNHPSPTRRSFTFGSRAGSTYAMKHAATQRTSALVPPGRQ